MLAPPALVLDLASPTDQSARWSDAYRLWLASRRSPSTRRAYRAAWDSLIAHTAKAPWEISRADVTAWIETQRAAGLPALQLRLEDEIDAARVAGRRMLELSKQMTDPMDGIRALSLFSSHLARIASLMRLQAILTGGSNETSDAISTAILAVAKEFHIL